ncbi:MAG: class I SAM-dependent methyltransferase [Ferrovibrio sp.]
MKRSAVAALLRGSARTAWLAVQFPKVAVAALLLRIPPVGLLRMRIEAANTEDRVKKKQAHRLRGEAVGWADSSRQIRLMVLGRAIPLIQLNGAEEANLQQFYFSRPARFIEQAIGHLRDRGFDLALPPRARIFEPGCNAGRYLYYFSDTYDCSICGADIFPPAIHIARKADLFRCARFITADLLRSPFLELFEDRHFDLVVCSSHLSHIMHATDKPEEYLRRLQRIARTTIFLELPSEPLIAAARRAEFETFEVNGVLYGFARQESPT